MERIGQSMMFDTLKIAQDFSRAANTYDAQSQLQKQVLAKLLQFGKSEISCLTDHDTMLDAGCGTGYLSEMKHLFDGSLIGCDLAEGMCNKARQRGYSQVPINANLEQLPFADGRFSGAVCSLTLQWIDPPAQALRELRRILKPGAFLLLSSFGPATLKELRHVYAARDDALHVSPFMQYEHLCQELSQSGFSIAHMDTEIITTHFASVQAIAHHLRQIGATNKVILRQKGLMTPRKLASLESDYERLFGDVHGLPVSWEIHYALGKA